MGNDLPNRCAHVKEDETKCQAVPRHGSPYCFFHDPALAAEREAARIAGGVARSRKAAVLPPETPEHSLASSADVIALLGETVNLVLRGKVDPRISNAVGYLIGILLKAQERDDLEKRLARLETVVLSRKATAESVSSATSAFEPANPERRNHARP